MFNQKFLNVICKFVAISIMVLMVFMFGLTLWIADSSADFAYVVGYVFYCLWLYLFIGGFFYMLIAAMHKYLNSGK